MTDLGPLAAAASLATLLLSGAARAEDFRARDDVAPLMTAGLLDRKDALGPELFTRYWRDAHGPLAARIHGFHQYWQHHLGLPLADYWPVSGVDQSVPDAYRIEGFAETTFRAAADRERLGQDPAARALFFDERNVFRATYLYPAATGASRTLLDRLPDGAPQGRATADKAIALVRAAGGAGPTAFRAFLGGRLAPALARSPDALKVRLHLLQPFDPAAWDTPGVRHDLPAGARHHAILELAFADAAARGRALAGAEVAAALRELPRHAAALHTYPEVATYTLVHGDRPTLVGLKGLPVAETILATGAENQAQPEVLRLLHGPDIGAPSATAFRSRSQAGAR